MTGYICNRKIVLTSLTIVSALMLLRCCRSNTGVSVIRKGDSYNSAVSLLKDNFRFMFRLNHEGALYAGFRHLDTYDVLIFRNDILAYIGKDVEIPSELGKFKNSENGKVERIHFRRYMNPVVHAESLIGRLVSTRDRLMVHPYPVESYAHGKIDWGLTCAVMLAKVVATIAGCLGGNHRTFTDVVGFDFGRIPLGFDRKHVLELFGDPVYVDVESNVEYYVKYGDVIGLTCTNGIVKAVFSSAMLDYRITCRYGGLEYLSSEPAR